MMVSGPMIRRIGAMLLVMLGCGAAAAQGNPAVDRDQGYGKSDKNWIAGLEIVRRPAGYFANFDYHYTGLPEGASVHIRQMNIQDGSKDKPDLSSPKPVPAQMGQIRVTVPLARPPEENVPLTVEVTAELRLPNDGAVVASRTLRTRALWPSQAEVRASLGGFPAVPASPPPGTDRNLISGLEVKKGADGRWAVLFDYFYTGQPEGAKIRVNRRDSGQGINPVTALTFSPEYPALRGWNRFSLVLDRPLQENLSLTLEVMPELRGADATLLAKETLQARLEWPSRREANLQRELAQRTPEQVVAYAVDLIDEGSPESIERAKDFLERAIEGEPRLDIAYIEMARVSMKLNWGPEGLQQAEKFLDSAISIRDSANARILLGYVYAFQKRYAKSQALLADAAKSNPPNLWLWANWGELEELQGHVDKAIAMYGEALARPRTTTSYDRARVFSYDKLFALLHGRNDVDGIENLHKQRTQEYGARDCYGVAYARFLIQRRADASAAIALARGALEGNCARTAVRNALGLAHYLAWSRERNQQGSTSLNQARIYFPVGAKLFYELAQSDGTSDVARQLTASGEPIDMADNMKWNALAYALQNKEHAVAGRLLKLGAKPGALVTEEQFPVAFLPVFLKDEAGIRLMQRSGIDYTNLRHKGSSAIDLARQAGEQDLLKLLERPAT